MIEIFTLYVLCEREEEQPSNFSRYIQAICKWPNSSLCPAVLCETQLSASSQVETVCF